jgi:hypothetical protein
LGVGLYAGEKLAGIIGDTWDQKVQDKKIMDATGIKNAADASKDFFNAKKESPDLTVDEYIENFKKNGPSQYIKNVNTIQKMKKESSDRKFELSKTPEGREKMKQDYLAGQKALAKRRKELSDAKWKAKHK